jgi:Protein phosphatase inhibitor 2 (IPP-2)
LSGMNATSRLQIVRSAVFASHKLDVAFDAVVVDEPKTAMMMMVRNDDDDDDDDDDEDSGNRQFAPSFGRLPPAKSQQESRKAVVSPASISFNVRYNCVSSGSGSYNSNSKVQRRARP